MATLGGRVHSAPRTTAVALTSSGARQRDVLKFQAGLVNLGEALEVGRLVRRVQLIPDVPIGLGVEENDVVDGPEPSGGAVRTCAFPDDLVAEVSLAEDLIKHDLEVVRLPSVEMDEENAVVREELANQ